MTKNDLKENLINYSIKLLKSGLRLNRIQENNFGLIGYYDLTEHSYVRQTKLEYIHIMTYPQYSNKNIEKSIMDKNPGFRNVVLDDRGLPSNYVCLSALVREPEYTYINDLLGNSINKQTHDLRINQIEEGLAILNILNAPNLVRKAYCLHMLFESDEALSKSMELNRMPHTDPKSVLLAMEFRNIIKTRINGKIKLSPLSEVNQMILAAKIQRYKTFEILYKGEKPHSDEIERDYQLWIKRLYNELINDNKDPMDFYLYCRDFINLKNHPYKQKRVILDSNMSVCYAPVNKNEISIKPPLILNHHQINSNASIFRSLDGDLVINNSQN